MSEDNKQGILSLTIKDRAVLYAVFDRQREDALFIVFANALRLSLTGLVAKSRSSPHDLKASIDTSHIVAPCFRNQARNLVARGLPRRNGTVSESLQERGDGSMQLQ